MAGCSNASRPLFSSTWPVRSTHDYDKTVLTHVCQNQIEEQAKTNKSGHG